ncbi:hypothetical protein F1559_004078 [Cyanidiococcus yangmingshanensis]|uniref:SRP54-type proteins GTP-binding domain-containing protein n=1 Tax=Cyanidiococcus yangmingshanensis TaxID=2690220 RepID=A0A7J7IGI0_9RHOD|nr:hypothetical protein F1559_004078 [Cyanidiococcus yangmingshanensis]
MQQNGNSGLGLIAKPGVLSSATLPGEHTRFDAETGHATAAAETPRSISAGIEDDPIKGCSLGSRLEEEQPPVDSSEPFESTQRDERWSSSGEEPMPTLNRETTTVPMSSATDTRKKNRGMRRQVTGASTNENVHSHRKPIRVPSKPASGRRWDDNAMTPEELAALDLSSDAPRESSDLNAVERARAIYLEARPRGSVFESPSEPQTATDDDAVSENGNGSLTGAFLGVFARLTGTKPLTHADLEQPLQFFRDRLITRNVAPVVAEKLTQSVGASLENRVLDALTVHRMVRSAMEDALKRVLQPMQGDQRLDEVIRKRRERASNSRPFVIVFTGVNGVGKSTTLAKIGFLLQKQGMRLLIAAGDTFRAGAIEQLRIHARCLDVPLFEQGYGKDPAAVAASAIAHAEEQGLDVVLVDTAGRMQDNEPLMKALAKLVQRAEPDRVLFVGEALVGNEAIDQLVKFNRALVTFQKSSSKPRLIDGIVLTKFDAVDEKVGAAITMIYTTSIPIVYVGTGQTYHDLEPMNIPNLVKALLH